MSLFTYKHGDYWFKNPRKVSKKKSKKGGTFMSRKRKVRRNRGRKKTSTLTSLKRWLSGVARKRRSSAPKRRKRRARRKGSVGFTGYPAGRPYSGSFSDNPRRRHRSRYAKKRRYNYRVRSRRRRNPLRLGGGSAVYKIGFTALGMLFPLVLSSMIPVRFPKKWQNIALGCFYAAIGYGVAHLSGTTKKYKSHILAGGIAGVIVSEFREYILVKALKDTFGIGAGQTALPANTQASKAKTELYYTGPDQLNLKELGEAFNPYANDVASSGYIQ